MKGMKGYSYQIEPNKEDFYAWGRVEDVNASYKDLAQVCERIRGKKLDWALSFLESASQGKIPVYYSRYNKGMGHRKELKGRKGRWPKKAASIVLKLLNSVFANARVKGLSDDLIVIHAAANKKHNYPRLAPKGRRVRQDLETARIEIILKERIELPKKKKKEKKEEKGGKKTEKGEKEEKAKGEKKNREKKEGKEKEEGKGKKEKEGNKNERKNENKNA